MRKVDKNRKKKKEKKRLRESERLKEKERKRDKEKQNEVRELKFRQKIEIELSVTVAKLRCLHQHCPINEEHNGKKEIMRIKVYLEIWIKSSFYSEVV